MEIDAELEDPDSWDWEHPVELPPVENPEAVLRIRVSPSELKQISLAAEARGLKLFDYIRLRLTETDPAVPATNVASAGALRDASAPYSASGPPSDP